MWTDVKLQGNILGLASKSRCVTDISPDRNSCVRNEKRRLERYIQINALLSNLCTAGQSLCKVPCLVL